MTAAEFEVDDCVLTVETIGEDEPPPVVIVPAMGGDKTEWELVRAELTVPMTLVFPGRPNLAGSGPLPCGEASRPRSFGWAADQLHALLTAAGIGSPRILVGHSIGGLIVERYAVQHPDHVTGAVFVDCTDPELFLETRDRGFLHEGDAGAGGTIYNIAASCADYDQHPPARPVPNAVVVSSAIGRWARCTETERFADMSMRQVDQNWQDHQHRLAQRTGAVLLLAHFAGHRLDSEAPRLLAEAIDTVVTAARDGTGLRFDADRLFDAEGRLVE